MGSLVSGRFHVRKIAIIGAGPCGLCAAKYLRAENAFDSITIFDQQAEVGGVWNYNSHTPGPYPVPQEDPLPPQDLPTTVPTSSQNALSSPPLFVSPMYETLHTNIPSQLMEFTDQKFPKDAWLFPRRQTVQEYLLSYAADLRQFIKLSCQVSKISLRPQDGRDRWHVEAKSTVSDECFKGDFDAVVVANGHYSTPFIPNMGNIAAFNKAHPSVIMHSKHYKAPESFAGKRVVIVGNGPSGVDIALQINRVCKQPAFLSVKHATQAERLAFTGCREVPEIAEFLVEKRGVQFADGTVESDIDAVVFCTGFLFSYPFLQPELRSRLISNGKGVHGLYKHLFSIDHPTMVFPGLNIKSVPWPVSEGQSAVLSAIWANKIELPDVADMERWSQALEKERAPTLQTLQPLEDAHYINELHAWASRADGGKEPPYWDEEKFWERRIFADAKLRFEQQGCKATTLEDLGLRYEAEDTILDKSTLPA